MKAVAVYGRTMAVAFGSVLLGLAAPARAQIDLGDIAVGGDGTGSAQQGLGLRVTDGQFVPPTEFGGSYWFGSSLFLPTPGLPYVDGVFSPNSTTTISSTNMTFAFPDTGGWVWDTLRNAGAVYEPDVNPPHLHLIQLGDQPGMNRKGLGIHANQGITYNLDALRTSGATFDRVAGVGGLNFSALQAPGDFELWILVDGVESYHQIFANNALTYEPFSIDLSSGSHFLTIATTDYDYSNYADHAVIADLRLLPEPGALAMLGVLAVLARRRAAVRV
jgi:hypothetical protein